MGVGSENVPYFSERRNKVVQADVVGSFNKETKSFVEKNLPVKKCELNVSFLSLPDEAILPGRMVYTARMRAAFLRDGKPIVTILPNLDVFLVGGQYTISGADMTVTKKQMKQIRRFCK